MSKSPSNTTTLLLAALFSMVASSSTPAAQPTSYAYLRENNPYYVGRDFPKLTTPQWVGEPGVEAVVVLAIDDMREPPKYEAYLRPILSRLKQIDGRAPASIMTCNIQPDDPQLAAWVQEGLSLEIHTIDHPCPLLHGGKFDVCKSTYDRCVDQLNQVPGNVPVAFRTPCCDSLNTVSPRFYSEIFQQRSPGGKFLQIDTSVFNIFNSSDPSIPRELLLDKAGNERFLKYVPTGNKWGERKFDTFVNTIENYPYPYVINGTCWQFPCVVPSDWEAQHLHKPFNPLTVDDMKAALDITVHKQGVFCLVFHPHGWIESLQVVDLIDHAVKKHGPKVKFLNFREAAARLNEHLLAGNSLRVLGSGQPAGISLLDVNADGFQDVIIPGKSGSTRVWNPATKAWNSSPNPLLTLGNESTEHFEVASVGGKPALFPSEYSPTTDGLPYLQFEGTAWKLAGRVSFKTDPSAKPDTARSRLFATNLDAAGDDELLLVSSQNISLLQHSSGNWTGRSLSPPESELVKCLAENPRTGRLVDLDGDADQDLIVSTPHDSGVALFQGMSQGWQTVWKQRETWKPGSSRKLLPFVLEDGTHSGHFVHSGALFWQNEHTDHLPNFVLQRKFPELLQAN